MVTDPELQSALVKQQASLLAILHQAKLLCLNEIGGEALIAATEREINLSLGSLATS
jgi:hypothetical protein